MWALYLKTFRRYDTSKLTKIRKKSIFRHVWQSISLQPIEISQRYFVHKLVAIHYICPPKIGPVSLTVLAPWGARMCRNLRLLCRYAEMSISDYVWDSISSSVVEISWRYLSVQIKSKCSIRSWNCSLTASTVRTVGGAKIGRNCNKNFANTRPNRKARLPVSALCVTAVHICLGKLWNCRLERYGRKWENPRLFLRRPVIPRRSPRV